MWQEDELESIHQLAASIEVDLPGAEGVADVNDKSQIADVEQPLSSFLGTYLRIRPPLKLLMLAKDAFKCRGAGDGKHPGQAHAARLLLGRMIDKSFDFDKSVNCGCASIWFGFQSSKIG